MPGRRVLIAPAEIVVTLTLRLSSHLCRNPAMNKLCAKIVELWKAANISPVVRNVQPGETGTILVCVTRNEGWRLPCFLDHHRMLGVRHFVFIDNGSSDTTVEFLSGQPDTDLYFCGDTFSSLAQRAWRHKVMAVYGHHRWYLNLDADEHLIYDGMGEKSLDDVTALLEKESNPRPRGVLVDLYGSGSQKDYLHLDTCLQMIAYCRYFDGDGYTEYCSKHRVRLTGGVRARMFRQTGYTGHEPALAKYPLAFFTEEDLIVSGHHMYPAHKNFLSESVLGLLHYKFSKPDFMKIDDALKRQVYAKNSEEYQLYARWFAENPEGSFHYPGSVEFTSPDDLIKAGLIGRLPWGERTPANATMLNWTSLENWRDGRKREKIV